MDKKTEGELDLSQLLGFENVKVEDGADLMDAVALVHNKRGAGEGTAKLPSAEISSDA